MNVKQELEVCSIGEGQRQKDKTNPLEGEQTVKDLKEQIHFHP